MNRPTHYDHASHTHGIRGRAGAANNTMTSPIPSKRSSTPTTTNLSSMNQQQHPNSAPPTSSSSSSTPWKQRLGQFLLKTPSTRDKRKLTLHNSNGNSCNNNNNNNSHASAVSSSLPLESQASSMDDASISLADGNGNNSSLDNSFNMSMTQFNKSHNNINDPLGGSSRSTFWKKTPWKKKKKRPSNDYALHEPPEYLDEDILRPEHIAKYGLNRGPPLSEDDDEDSEHFTVEEFDPTDKSTRTVLEEDEEDEHLEEEPLSVSSPTRRTARPTLLRPPSQANLMRSSNHSNNQSSHPKEQTNNDTANNGTITNTSPPPPPDQEKLEPNASFSPKTPSYHHRQRQTTMNNHSTHTTSLTGSSHHGKTKFTMEIKASPSPSQRKKFLKKNKEVNTMISPSSTVSPANYGKAKLKVQVNHGEYSPHQQHQKNPRQPVEYSIPAQFPYTTTATTTAVPVETLTPLPPHVETTIIQKLEEQSLSSRHKRTTIGKEPEEEPVLKKRTVETVVEALMRLPQQAKTKRSKPDNRRSPGVDKVASTKKDPTGRIFRNGQLPALIDLSPPNARPKRPTTHKRRERSRSPRTPRQLMNNNKYPPKAPHSAPTTTTTTSNNNAIAVITPTTNRRRLRVDSAGIITSSPVTATGGTIVRAPTRRMSRSASPQVISKNRAHRRQSPPKTPSSNTTSGTKRRNSSRRHHSESPSAIHRQNSKQPNSDSVTPRTHRRTNSRSTSRSKHQRTTGDRQQHSKRHPSPTPGSGGSSHHRRSSLTRRESGGRNGKTAASTSPSRGSNRSKTKIPRLKDRLSQSERVIPHYPPLPKNKDGAHDNTNGHGTRTHHPRTTTGTSPSPTRTTQYVTNIPGLQGNHPSNTVKQKRHMPPQSPSSKANVDHSGTSGAPAVGRRRSTHREAVGMDSSTGSHRGRSLTKRPSVNRKLQQQPPASTENKTALPPSESAEGSRANNNGDSSKSAEPVRTKVKGKAFIEEEQEVEEQRQLQSPVSKSGSIRRCRSKEENRSSGKSHHGDHHRGHRRLTRSGSPTSNSHSRNSHNDRKSSGQGRRRYANTSRDPANKKEGTEERQSIGSSSHHSRRHGHGNRKSSHSRQKSRSTSSSRSRSSNTRKLREYRSVFEDNPPAKKTTTGELKRIAAESRDAKHAVELPRSGSVRRYRSEERQLEDEDRRPSLYRSMSSGDVSGPSLGDHIMDTNNALDQESKDKSKDPTSVSEYSGTSNTSAARRAKRSSRHPPNLSKSPHHTETPGRHLREGVGSMSGLLARSRTTLYGANATIRSVPQDLSPAIKNNERQKLKAELTISPPLTEETVKDKERPVSTSELAEFLLTAPDVGILQIAKSATSTSESTKQS